MEEANILQTQTPEPEAPDAKKHFSRIGLRLFIGVIIMHAVSIGSALLCAKIWPQIAGNTTMALVASYIPMLFIGYPAMYLLLKPLPAEQPGNGQLGPKWFFMFFLMTYGCMVVANLVGTLVGALIETLFPGTVAATNDVQTILMDGNMFVTFLFAVVCAPILEELIFRKLLVDRTLIYGEGVSIVFSGLVFGLFHGNLTQFVYAFVIGVIFALVYARTGKIYITIALHMMLNFIGGILGVLVIKKLGAEDMLSGLTDMSDMSDLAAMAELMQTHGKTFILLACYALVLYGMVFAGIILLIVNRKALTPRPGKLQIPKGQRFATVICNLGMVLFLVLMIFIIVAEIVGLNL
jgi:membrane protease YdiL (CAAX protease family)